MSAIKTHIIDVTLTLLPCPFCGAGPKLAGNGYNSGTFTVYCDTCFAVQQSDQDKAQAVAKWNTRKPT